jgi:hypothetical protein
VSEQDINRWQSTIKPGDDKPWTMGPGGSFDTQKVEPIPDEMLEELAHWLRMGYTPWNGRSMPLTSSDREFMYLLYYSAEGLISRMRAAERALVSHEGLRTALAAIIESVRKSTEVGLPFHLIEQALQALSGTPPEPGRPRWPAGNFVGRMGDMAPPGKTHLIVGYDGDMDALLEVWDHETGEGQRATIEFCTGRGGGRSPRTRAALIALMCAIEDDNAAVPSKAWPPAAQP